MTFTGWSDVVEYSIGNGSFYIEGSSFIVVKDTVLYAQWDFQSDYKPTFKPNNELKTVFGHGGNVYYVYDIGKAENVLLEPKSWKMNSDSWKPLEGESIYKWVSYTVGNETLWTPEETTLKSVAKMIKSTGDFLTSTTKGNAVTSVLVLGATAATIQLGTVAGALTVPALAAVACGLHSGSEWYLNNTYDKLLEEKIGAKVINIEGEAPRGFSPNYAIFGIYGSINYYQVEIYGSDGEHKGTQLTYKLTDCRLDETTVLGDNSDKCYDQYKKVLLIKPPINKGKIYKDLSKLLEGNGTINEPYKTYDKKSTILYAGLFPNKKFSLELNQPGLEYIPNDYLYGVSVDLSNLIELKIVSEKTKGIGSMAFAKTGIRKISIPHIVTISAGAFGLCNNLCTIEAGNVKYIGECAFWSCRSLERVVLSSVHTIDKNAFYNCSALTVVDLPKVALIKSGAFSGTNIEKIKFTTQKGKETVVEDGAFYNYYIYKLKNLKFLTFSNLYILFHGDGLIKR